ncbi:type 1 glutamine amidotransferase [Terrihabitans rhizophilus]|uniref:Type 1 glutamine amidotransferase n=1 Tax=Terrihabitans rhizophilus TaxID=3092662 RepID=A0ABU4RNH4_9HYPH|nr:type 1 glutamine amidotransferase [Terrihabitans sp. PJ23]MDX6805659.1 type 1 glutamine amidotransferase [Terrihabitans sp. PJ23]
MTRAPRLLVVEGNTQRARERQAAIRGKTYSEGYSDVLRHIVPDAVVDICFPADPGANLPDSGGLGGYDGVAMTGSSLNIYDEKPECLRQVDFARAVFDSGVPFFGSCWGLQVATVAAGGSVRRSPKGREIGLARKIALTEAGRAHPMHDGKGWAFDAPAVHTDEVSERPSGMTVTATNSFSEVQAAEIRHGNGTFWGVQYHPEFTLKDMIAVLERYGRVLVEEGPFRAEEDLHAHVTDLRALEADPSRTDLSWRLGYDRDVLDEDRRLSEIRNWIAYMVRPAMAQRGRI